MSTNKTKLGSRHPKVVLIHEDDEDIVGVSAIIQEQVEDFRSVRKNDETRKLIFELRPPVILFALNSVMDSIEIYSELVADETISHTHQAILLCNNKESGIAFRSCIKGLFDDYFVYQPLYEKFRLKMVIHAAMQCNQLKIDYQGYREELLESVDEELAELIEIGGVCKKGLLESIQECKTNLEQVAVDSSPNVNNIIQEGNNEDLIEELAKKHVEPLLGTLEKEIVGRLSGMMENLIQQHQIHKTKISGSDIPSQGDRKRLLKNTLQGDNKNKALPDKNGSILVVEDNEVYREMLSEVLSNSNYKVDQARDGIDALKKIKIHEYDCVLMDLFMPKLDGLNATKQIKKVNGGKELPVIALSGNKSKDVAKKWAAFGLKGYLVKPSSKEEIISTVSRVLS